MLVCRPQGGVEEVPVPPELVNAPCLDQGQITAVGAVGRHPGGPLSPNPRTWSGPWMKTDRLWLLQSRPLQLPPKKAPEPPARTLKQYPVLLDQGPWPAGRGGRPRGPGAPG